MNELILERYALATARLAEVAQETVLAAPYLDYFQKEAQFLLLLRDFWTFYAEDGAQTADLTELAAWNERLYEEILPKQYETSYANPAYAVSVFGTETGRLFSMVAATLRKGILACSEQRLDKLTIYMELFLELYATAEESIDLHQMRQSVYWFESDYADVFAADIVRERVGVAALPYVQIVQEAAADLRYLYRYGVYISEETKQLADYLFAMDEAEIDRIAETIVEGYRTGYVLNRRDITLKKYAPVMYHVGTERIIQNVIGKLAQLDIRPVIRHVFLDVQSANRQYGYDHRFDDAIYLDRQYKERYLQVYRTEYENCKEEARRQGGPVCLETFGEEPFSPVSKAEAPKYSEKQRIISIELQQELRQIVNTYIPQEESSFTIMAIPTPDIGPQFGAIFRECMEVNTLDVQVYREIQQKIIDALDQGTSVVIRGRNGNETDLRVALHTLADPQTQTNFENCLADVNIPVGEVFTSPQLAGTNGLLHVSRVFLNGLEYLDLRLQFQDGMVTEYSCGNFADREEGRAYIRENLLHQRETLPMGEFAIGTNTTAFAMGVRYDMFRQLPILIAEKTGPHFAVGDTCYSYAEDVAVFNPDGKEIIARDNECSLLRKTEPDRAYFSCHTDITIPYFELGEISAVRADGSRIPIITDCRFVLPGTELLNEPLEGLESK